MIEILKAILFGIVEGVTEWLPISSTGHMILLNNFIALNVSAEFWDMFEVVIQLGAILSVILLFWNKLWPFSAKKSSAEKRSTWRLWLTIIVGVLPSAIVGTLLDDWFNAHFYNYVTVAITLVLYGIIFIVIERHNANRKPRIGSTGKISLRDALMVGVFQILSIIPGTSRSGSTIIGGMLFGLSRPVAAEYSFFLAIPTMVGASLLKTAKFVQTGVAVSSQEWTILLVACVTAFLVSLVSIRFLMNFVKRHTFSAFGIYRIILGVIVLGYYLIWG